MQSIRKRSFSGEDGDKFAKMFFPRDEMTMMVREQDLADTIRKPITKKNAREVLSHIKKWDGDVSEQWKSRANTHQAKLDDGDPFALAEVFKALSLRQEEDKLSAADRRHLGQAEQCLSEELSMALGQSERKVAQRMVKAAVG